MTPLAPVAPSPTALHLRVRKVEPLTPSSVHPHFEPHPGTPPYQPEQYLTLVHDHGGVRLHRSYSLTSVPGLDDDLSIAVKRTASGPVSAFLTRQVRPRDVLSFMPPAGHFHVTPNPERPRHEAAGASTGGPPCGAGGGRPGVDALDQLLALCDLYDQAKAMFGAGVAAWLRTPHPGLGSTSRYSAPRAGFFQRRGLIRAPRHKVKCLCPQITVVGTTDLTE